MNFRDSCWSSELPVGKRDRSNYFELINEYGYSFGVGQNIKTMLLSVYILARRIKQFLTSTFKALEFQYTALKRI